MRVGGRNISEVYAASTPVQRGGGGGVGRMMEKVKELEWILGIRRRERSRRENCKGLLVIRGYKE